MTNVTYYYVNRTNKYYELFYHLKHEDRELEKIPEE
jgi:hypothetical protein